ncbi:unnamed protein product [Symbiodinium natans]|uniref:C3H1-type domain-containing protein n=1 Tax=Symbiodinium natans TaxID=878477 RepID=A0A812MHX6_9DINO|nr:unnamed protein product [Symbiodinium natans]
MTLVLKSSFIHLQEHGRLTSRSKSLPPKLQVRCQNTTDKYLEQVQHRATNLQPLPPLPPPPTPAPEDDEMADEEQDPEFPGSRGHPELCRRPCVFVGHGSCQAGLDCRFCHFTHDRGFRPSKRLRNKMRGLNVPSILLLLRNGLQMKAAQLAQDLPSFHNLRAMIEHAWANVDQTAAHVEQTLQARVSSHPVSALLGDQVIGRLDPVLYQQIRQELTALRAGCPEPVTP